MKIFVLFLFSICASLEVYTQSFTYEDINKATSELFLRHVQFNEFESKLAKRSFHTAIERFDSLHFYLLQSEVTPFLNISEGELEQTVAQFNNKRFDTYLPLQKLFTKSIKRARKYRAYAKSKLIAEEYAHVDMDIKSSFATSDKELQLRMEYMMRGWLSMYADAHNLSYMDRELKLKVLDFYEQKRREKEDQFLPSRYGSADYFPLFIAKSIAASLDAHTMVYSQDEATSIRKAFSKEGCGVGVIVKEDIDGPVISGCLKGSPAAVNGALAAGDRITHLDGVSIEGKSFKDVLNLMEGTDGSRLSITAISKDGTVKSVKLQRKKLIMEHERITISTEPFLNGVIATLGFNSFYDNHNGISLENDLRKALEDLKRRGEVYGVVLDLRHNLGGYLHQAVKTASLFIQEGVIVVAKYAKDEVRYTRDLDPRSAFHGPLVILTSKASASAAEIVAQSLQDIGVGLVVGDKRTYGKGSMQIQTLTDPKAEYYYKVTVGRYYTASGRSTQIDGVQADIVVPSRYAPYPIGERFLTYPITTDKLFNQLKASNSEVEMVMSMHQKKSPSTWEKMLPTLKQNSATRLTNDENFSAFNAYVKEKKENPLATPQKTYGRTDLQMKEAKNIIKDMVLLQQN